MAKLQCLEEAPLVFQPNPDQLTEIPLFADHNPPRYLFPIYTPDCLVQTSLSTVIPRENNGHIQATAAGCREHLECAPAMVEL